MNETADNIQVSTLIQTACFRCQTPEEAQVIASFIAEACPNPRLAIVGITEILFNSIEHGNLDISFEDKEKLQGERQWLKEIHRRLQQPKYKAKHVTIETAKSEQEITIVITDEGEGFDWEKYLNSSEERIVESHGRGIMMAKNLLFKDVRYNEKGNQVTCVISLI